jgi:hypothetical protein
LSFTTSRNFSLPQGRESLRLHLVPRSALLHGTGLVMMLTGTLVGLAGGSGLIAAPGQTNSTLETTIRGLGVVGVVAGVLTLAAGIPIWLATYSTAKTDDGKTLGATRPMLSF